MRYEEYVPVTSTSAAFWLEGMSHFISLHASFSAPTKHAPNQYPASFRRKPPPRPPCALLRTLRGITERLCKPATQLLPLGVFNVHSARIRDHTFAAMQCA
jgi:hypothetical protein